HRTDHLESPAAAGRSDLCSAVGILRAGHGGHAAASLLPADPDPPLQQHGDHYRADVRGDLAGYCVDDGCAALARVRICHSSRGGSMSSNPAALPLPVESNPRAIVIYTIDVVALAILR